MQRFRDFEVVITDDSPDDAVAGLCRQYASHFPLHYFKNERPLGMPENWNAAVRWAASDWIKIMHDDDWFADENSLATYAQAVKEHPEARFIFSAYRDVFLETTRSREMRASNTRYKAFLRDHTVLFSANIIGAPSVVLYKRIPGIEFDPLFRWRVDIDFYIRYLAIGKPAYIPDILVNIGLGKSQVTRDCFNLRPVEIPENLSLLYRVGVHHLRNILVYDAFWRLVRNLEIRRLEEISESGYHGEIPAAVLSMIRWQQLLPLRLWRIGPVSKLGMWLNYLVNKGKIRERISPNKN
jgi:glycosyltransferase involved in cell wall biosynthesis